MNSGAGSARLQPVPHGKSPRFCAFNDAAEDFFTFSSVGMYTKRRRREEECFEAQSAQVFP